jgi:hypothetical protein
MTLSYGRSRSGTRVIKKTNKYPYKRFNLLSQLKHYIKKKSPNTYEEIDKVIKDILANKITQEHLKNYLKHSFKLRKENI